MIDVKEMTNEDGIVILTLNGELKIVSAEDSKTRINNSITEANAKKVVLDLSGLEFLDSAGLAVFISAYKKMTVEEGKIAICGLNGQPKTIFEISNMQRIINVFPTLDEALRSF